MEIDITLRNLSLEEFQQISAMLPKGNMVPPPPAAPADRHPSHPEPPTMDGPIVTHITTTGHVDFSGKGKLKKAKAKQSKAKQSKDKTHEDKRCEWCGLPFVAKQKRTKFCSKVCYMKDYWKTYKPHTNGSGPKPVTQATEQDINTCKKGEEKFREVPKMHPEGKGMIQFYYRDLKGELFTTLAATLKDAQELRDEWLQKKLMHA